MTDTTLDFESAHADYRRWLVGFFSGVPLVLAVLAALAWRETEAGGGPQWLLFVVGLPLVSAWVLWRTRDAAATVDVAGRLRVRSVTGDATVDLNHATDVMLMPTLAYDDQLTSGHVPSYGYVVRDADGARATIARGLPWTDTAPVLRQVARALRSGQGRCDPLTWDRLHDDAGLAPTPFPGRLTRPDEATWGRSLRLSRRQRTSTLVALFALTGIPMVAALTGFFGLASDHLGRALTALAGGVVVTGLAWTLLWQSIRRGDRDRVAIGADGRMATSTRRTTAFLTLGYRLDEGQVDLRSLRRVQAVPGARTHENHRDRPAWWRLELEDDAGGQAAVNLLHPRVPRATLFPQLVHHLERSDVVLDEATRRVIERRLGRPLQRSAGA